MDAVLALGLHLISTNQEGMKQEAGHFFKKAQELEDQGQLYFEYALVFKFLNELDQGNSKFVIDKYNRSQDKLSMLGFPDKFYLYLKLFNEGLLTDENMLVFSLLAYDLDYQTGLIDA